MDFNLSPSRPGVFVGLKLNGSVDVFDLLKSTTEPVLTTQIFPTSEATCCDLDSTGKYVLCGTEDGLIALAELSNSLSMNQSAIQDRNEKQFVL